MIDLMSAARGAVYAALAATVDPALAAVFDDVPQGTQPPFLKVGAIDSESRATKGEQLERLTVEVIAVHRGEDRGVLLAMMHAARAALDGQAVTAPDAALRPPRFESASASDVGPDGVTYAGLITFTIDAQPI